MNVDQVTTVLVAIAAVPANLFPLLYGLRSPWYVNALGRALLALAVGTALLIDLSLLRYVLGEDYPGRDQLRLVIYGLVTVGLWGQFLALLRAQRRRPPTAPATSRTSNRTEETS